MDAWTLLILFGVSAIWVALVLAVVYLTGTVPARH
jgi:hypothetical protein